MDTHSLKLLCNIHFLSNTEWKCVCTFSVRSYTSCDLARWKAIASKLGACARSFARLFPNFFLCATKPVVEFGWRFVRQSDICLCAFAEKVWNNPKVQLSAFGKLFGWLWWNSLYRAKTRVRISSSNYPTNGPLSKSQSAILFAKTSIATWLILPVVVCLSRRLSHACKVQAPIMRAKPRMAH